MNYEFKFPDVGEGIAEGKLLKWHVKEGDSVKHDQVLAEIETDKAVVEIPSPKQGKILKLHYKEDDTVPVGQLLVTFEVEGTEPEIKPQENTAQSDSASAAEKAGAVVGFLEEASNEPKHDDSKEYEKPAEIKKAVIATLAVKKLARDLGIDIASVAGTGYGGRITEDDVKKSAGKTTPESEAPENSAPKDMKNYDIYGPVEHFAMNSTRRVIAHKMSESKFTAPHVTLMENLDVTNLFNLREQEKIKAKEKNVKLTYLAFIVKAVVQCLKKHPLLNSTIDEKSAEVVLKKYYNIGIAVDASEGLIVPVVKEADKRVLYDVANEIVRLADASQNKKLGLGDIKGGTFSITNIGSIAGTFFTPIINFPEVAILGLGRMQDAPAVVNGEIKIRKILPLSLSFDHRVVDGAEAARFMKDLVEILEKPEVLVDE